MSDVQEQLLELEPEADFAVWYKEPPFKEDDACTRVQLGPYVVFWKKTNANPCPAWEDVEKVVPKPKPATKREQLQILLTAMEGNATLPAQVRQLAKFLKE